MVRRWLRWQRVVRFGRRRHLRWAAPWSRQMWSGRVVHRPCTNVPASQAPPRAEVVRQEGALAGHEDAASESSGEGKEPAEAEAGREVGGDGTATRAGAGNGSARARIAGGKSSDGDVTGESGSVSWLGHPRGSGDSRGGEWRKGDVSRNRAPRDEDGRGRRGSSGEGKRARGGNTCEHNRERHRFEECRGASICEQRRRGRKWRRPVGALGQLRRQQNRGRAKGRG